MLHQLRCLNTVNEHHIPNCFTVNYILELGCKMLFPVKHIYGLRLLAVCFYLQPEPQCT